MQKQSFFSQQTRKLIPPWLISLKPAIDLLKRENPTKLLYLIFFQIISAFLDLIGIYLIGLMSLLAVNGLGVGGKSSRLIQVFEIFRMADKSFQFQTGFLAILAVAVFIIRSLCSTYLSRETLYYLSNKSIDISRKIMDTYFSQKAQSFSAAERQKLIYAITEGMDRIFVTAMGSCINIAVDGPLMILIIMALVKVDLIIALVTIILLTSGALILHKFQVKKAALLGSILTSNRSDAGDQIVSILENIKEIRLRGSQDKLLESLKIIRKSQSSSMAALSIIPFISKYFLESLMIFGALLIGSYQFLLKDATHAIATLSIFIVAGSRILPLLSRIQGSVITIRSISSASEPSFKLMEQLVHQKVFKHSSELQKNEFNLNEKIFYPMINVNSVHFKYENNSKEVLKNVSIEVKLGEFVAITGPSGSGKSTLLDLILGFNKPTNGFIEISGVEPSQAYETWPGQISIVPQKVNILKGSLKENILLGLDSDNFEDEYIISILRKLNLLSLVENLPNGLNSTLGEYGSRLSGGQKQRIGIARALLTRPRLIILDEATSSLDAKSEMDISDAILSIGGELTILSVAHRLSSIRKANRIYYLKEGAIIGEGSFIDLKRNLPEFREQTEALGI